MSQFTLKSNDIKRVLYKGKKFSGNSAFAKILLRRGKNSRIGIIISGKLCNAVNRNRIRRIYKEAFRTIYLDITPNLDIVILPKSTAIKGTFWDAKEFLEKIVKFMTLECRQIEKH